MPAAHNTAEQIKFLISCIRNTYDGPCEVSGSQYIHPSVITRSILVPDASISFNSGSATLVKRKTGANKAQNNDTQKLETDDKPVLSDALDNAF